MSGIYTTTFIPPPEDGSREEVIAAFLRGEVGAKTVVSYESDELTGWWPYEPTLGEPIVNYWYHTDSDWQLPFYSYVVYPQEAK